MTVVNDLGDQTSSQCSIKGSKVQMRHDWAVVTSVFSPLEFKIDQPSRVTLMRRFHPVVVTSAPVPFGGGKVLRECRTFGSSKKAVEVFKQEPKGWFDPKDFEQEWRAAIDFWESIGSKK